MKRPSFTRMLDVTKSAWFETAHLDIKGPQDCGNPSHYISCKNLVGKKTVTVPSINWSYKTELIYWSAEKIKHIVNIWYLKSTEFSRKRNYNYKVFWIHCEHICHEPVCCRVSYCQHFTSRKSHQHYVTFFWQTEFHGGNRP